MNTFKNVIHVMVEKLTLFSYYADENHARNVAYWLLEKGTGKSRIDCIAHPQDQLEDAQVDQLFRWVDQLTLEKYPLQYILETVPFGVLTIEVAPPTLIPRPETERWCMDLIGLLQKAEIHTQPLMVLDMCTGSGCIGLALAQALPKAHVYAVDISETALELARRNAQRNFIDSVTFVHSNLFETLDPAITFDIIVSNPPYISHAEWETLEPTVKNWEDSQALIAHNNGLEIIEKIITTSTLRFLKKESIVNNYNLPRLLIEIGHSQGDVVSNFFKRYFHDVHVMKDDAGHDRVVCGSTLFFNEYVHLS